MKYMHVPYLCNSYSFFLTLTIPIIIIHANLISLVMPPPATHAVRFNITTIQYVPTTTMMATTATTGEFDGRRENLQSCE